YARDCVPLPPGHPTIAGCRYRWHGGRRLRKSAGFPLPWSRRSFGRSSSRAAAQARRVTVHKTAHVLPPDVWDVVAEAAFEKFQQAVTVAVLLAAHDAEFFGLLGIVGLQAVHKIFVDAGI